MLRRKPFLVGYWKLDQRLKWLIVLASQNHEAAQVVQRMAAHIMYGAAPGKIYPGRIGRCVKVGNRCRFDHLRRNRCALYATSGKQGQAAQCKEQRDEK